MKRERVFCEHCRCRIKFYCGVWLHVLTSRVACKDASGNYTGTNARPREAGK